MAELCREFCSANDDNKTDSKEISLNQNLTANLLYHLYQPQKKGLHKNRFNDLQPFSMSHNLVHKIINNMYKFKNSAFNDK